MDQPPPKTVCLIDDDGGPIELYLDELRNAFGAEAVEQIKTLPEAVKHFERVANKEVLPAKVYIIDIMMPPIEERWFTVTAEGLRSGLFLLDQLREAEKQAESTTPAPVLMMTAVSNPDILELISRQNGVEVLAKLEWMPSDLSEEVKRIINLK